MGLGGFNPTRTKVQLKLGINRLKLLQQKKTQLNAVARKEIASLLEKGKEDSARVRVEHIIREDFNIEAMEILELYSELLLARYGLLESMKHCDQAIAEAVNTIIYAAPRIDVKELNMVRDQLIMKFGKEFAVAAMENQNDVVNSRIVHKLKVQTPDPVLVDQYLKTIAKAYDVPYEAGIGMDNVLETIPTGPTGSGFGFSSIPYTYPQQQFPTQFPAQLQQQQQQQQQSPYPPNVNAHVVPTAPADSGSSPDFPGVPGGFGGDEKGGSGPGDVDTLPNFDDLTRRFEALKKKK
ncbi:regulator of Vps4 activity in the MVB pathway-domain-containing protein [Fimicolochytrium jonesii]|uniref:regulator of Vps4 activity in the MVB pathway-domain-containing protein n=1 Tax=Fimicolochytrium jonesii TaxID=1396493 RepID=UPI0022FE199F|nr:regulator of Vps4 activity in the MVB pathway-domain-containing protein [Fimicolochytrium jonesii]KAI8816185.1 regulator of Vps4 activity in the MVB pathway-domain-containing protein [Fimicolochytrium jonesii]